eukprot:210153-Rhodomonas_salina.1
MGCELLAMNWNFSSPVLVLASRSPPKDGVRKREQLEPPALKYMKTVFQHKLYHENGGLSLMSRIG